jgi:undecaprenyl pyrophosphate phosphatase UppP
MSNLKLSQGLEVLRPKADQALPIPCNEWDVLKNKITELTTEPWFFHTVGSILIGASLATIISIITGAVSTTTIKEALIIAWAVTIVCALVGGACLLFANSERKSHKAKASDILTQMNLIEQRFEREEI